MNYEIVINKLKEDDRFRKFLDKISLNKSKNENPTIYVHSFLEEFDLFTEKIEKIKPNKINKVYYLCHDLSASTLVDFERYLKILYEHLTDHNLKDILKIFYSSEEKSVPFKNFCFLEKYFTFKSDKLSAFINKSTFQLDIFLNGEKKRFDFFNDLVTSKYLVTGSASEQSISKLLSKEFKTNFISSKLEYDYSSFAMPKRIYVRCDLNRSRFDKNEFKCFCNKIKPSKIFLIENLNPRPETLENDMNILAGVFTRNELRDNVNIFFTGSNANMDSIKSSFLSFNSFFNYLGICNEYEKKRFTETKIFVL